MGRYFQWINFYFLEILSNIFNFLFALVGFYPGFEMGFSYLMRRNRKRMDRISQSMYRQGLKEASRAIRRYEQNEEEG